MSRVAALAEKDPDGRMQSFELVYPAEGEDATTTGRSNGKRKERADVDGDEAMNGASDASPLTPVDDDGDDDSGSSPVNATRTGARGGRGAKKSRAAADGVKKTRAAKGGAAANQNQQGATPRIRTRAAAKAAGDVDM
jgi:hypothetical protein